MFKKIIYLVGCCLVIASSLAYSKTPNVSVAVLPYSASVAGDQTYASQLRQKTQQLLQKVTGFSVVSENVIDQQLKKHAKTTHDYSTPAAVTQVSQWVGARYFVFVKLRVLKLIDTQQAGSKKGTLSIQRTGRLSMTLYVFDASKQQFVLTQPMNVNRSQTFEFNASDGSSPIQATQVAFRQALLQEAAKIVKDKVETVALPIRVMRISGETVYINRGRSQGVRVGQYYAAYNAQPLVDPNNGQVLGYAHQPLARIQVNEVLENYATATLVTGQLQGILNAQLVAISSPAVSTTVQQPMHPRYYRMAPPRPRQPHPPW